MSVLYSQGLKSKYRITLELDVLNDFNPRDIVWDKVFQIQDNEQIDVYIEDLSIPDSY